MAVVWGDPATPPTKDQQKRIATLRAMQRKDSLDLLTRFNWNSPFLLSPHNSQVFYLGGKLPPDGDTAGDGKISDGVARLDVGLLETLRGMLGPLDLDGDNHVSRDCGRNICPDCSADCPASADYLAQCPEGPAS